MFLAPKMVSCLWLAFGSLVAQAVRVHEGEGGQGMNKQFRATCVQPWLPEDKACSARSREELPQLPAETVYSVQYASNPITSNGMGWLSELLSFTHSALVITEIKADGDTSAPTSLLFEYFARFFGPKAIMPTSLADGKPIWENQAVVGWRPAEEDEWLAKSNVTLVGTATGKTLNKWFEEVIIYGEQHPGYNLFNVWNSTDVFTRLPYVQDSVCHSFTEWSLATLYQLGADFSVEGALCRNYMSFITNTRPTILDLTSPADMRKISSFYGSLQSLASTTFRDMAAFGSTLLHAVKSELIDLEVVVFERGLGKSHGVYVGAKLTKPYVGVEPHQLSQRMILPWQKIPANADGECQHISTEKIVSMVTPGFQKAPKPESPILG